MAVYIDHRKPWYTDILSQVGSTLAGEFVKGMMQRDRNYRDDLAWRKQWEAAQGMLQGPAQGQPMGPTASLQVSGGAAPTEQPSPWGDGLNISVPEAFKPATGDGLIATARKAHYMPSRQDLMNAQARMSPRFQDKAKGLLELGYGNAIKQQDANDNLNWLGAVPDVNDVQANYNYNQRLSALGNDKMAATNLGFVNGIYDRAHKEKQNANEWAQRFKYQANGAAQKGLLARYGNGDYSKELQGAWKDLQDKVVNAGRNNVSHGELERYILNLYGSNPVLASNLLSMVSTNPQLVDSLNMWSQNPYYKEPLQPAQQNGQPPTANPRTVPTAASAPKPDKTIAAPQEAGPWRPSYTMAIEELMKKYPGLSEEDAMAALRANGANF